MNELEKNDIELLMDEEELRNEENERKCERRSQTVNERR